jgi:hypothetical protein
VPNMLSSRRRTDATDEYFMAQPVSVTRAPSFL